MKIRDASIGLKELNKTTVRNYDAWTKASLLSEEKLKALSGEILDINIDTIVNTQGYRVVGIFYCSDNTPVDGQLMGMPLVSPSKSAESEFLVDSMSLILYLACSSSKTTCGRSNWRHPVICLVF